MKLQIAFVASGRNQFIQPYLDYFQQAGHRISLISYDSFDANRESSYPIYDISSGAHARKKGTKWRYLLAAIKIRRVLDEIRPDIVHGHYVTSSGVICLLSGFRPYVVSARGTDVVGSMKSRLWRSTLRMVFSRSVLVHTVAESLSAEVRRLGVPAEKVWTLTQGVDTGAFEFRPPSPVLDRPIRLLCTRAFGDLYDPATIVRACALLRQDSLPFELIFAAAGETQPIVEALVTQLGLEKQVQFLGGYSNQDLPAMLGEADIYLSASQWDGTSVSLLEAMSAGVFPVVSRIAANSSWVQDGTTALMFDCGNEHQLAQAVRRAVDENELRIAAVRENRRLVTEKADRSTNMKRLEEKYCELLGLR